MCCLFVVVVVVVIVVVCMLNKGNMHHTVHMCTYAIRCDTGLDDRRLDDSMDGQRKNEKKRKKLATMSNKGNREAEARVKGKSEDKRKVIIVLEKACLEAVKTKKVRVISVSRLAREIARDLAKNQRESSVVFRESVVYFDSSPIIPYTGL